MSSQAPRAWALALLAASLAACTVVEPPHITREGTLPTGPDARFTLAEPAADPLLPTPALLACLESAGLHPGSKPAYLAQATLAIRPATSAVRTGAQAEGPPAPAPRGPKPHGDRLAWSLRIDRLADGAKLYELHADAAYDPRHATPESRAAQFCAPVKAP